MSASETIFLPLSLTHSRRLWNTQGATKRLENSVRKPSVDRGRVVPHLQCKKQSSLGTKTLNSRTLEPWIAVVYAQGDGVARELGQSAVTWSRPPAAI